MNGLGSTEGKSNIIYYVRRRLTITALMNCICTKQKYLKNGTPLTQNLCNYNTLQNLDHGFSYLHFYKLVQKSPFVF